MVVVVDADADADCVCCRLNLYYGKINVLAAGLFQMFKQIYTHTQAHVHIQTGHGTDTPTLPVSCRPSHLSSHFLSWNVKKREDNKCCIVL